MDLSKTHFATKAIHFEEFTSQHKPLVTPIFQTSTFGFDNADQGAARFMKKEDGYIYSRLGNPTVRTLERKMAHLDGADAALATGSGMAAISTALLALTKSGRHIVSDNCLYGCTFTFLQEHMCDRMGVDVTFVDASDPENVRKAMRPETDIVYIETPANPTMKVVDIEACAEIAHKNDAKLIVDNTFLTPYFQTPLSMGADLVVYSATKYLCGHGDAIAGIITGSAENIGHCFHILRDYGGIIAPLNAWLILRGLVTLPLRMDKHTSNAMEVAKFLEAHPKVTKVLYPGLKSHPQHELAMKQTSGSSGVITFFVKGGLEAGKTVMNSVKLCVLAVSLGDAESLIQHPASMTHAGIPKDEREKAGITDDLIRLSVGIEDHRDIIDDLRQALEKV